ncbi:MAG: UDP-N-acetylmuramoyl-tripeptide--D-alanyl-D-alanine ligase [Peptoniphilaceae bacterium]|nr:UDP-N-acetylmuramoyl-tripeptide--D-alanyl-D-alanine ligase [Peptoniphilaceae bacterium]MDD7383873.1 UDP-N-acetylmuramoyl-tripeptide--D-alanyl-D-alanine ligase [Peptoniphilaceae bacterium]MDY3738014.1 UDP-N-acetylmuramoyl-tripeptide--D-alanyl-D-alanine ligase [Peptoniphilaceae bacterium]
MIKRTLSQIAKMVSGHLDSKFDENLEIEGISIDSRTIDKNNLYIPIIGEKFDGRIFIKESENKGATAFLIDENYKIAQNINIPYIVVKDTKQALQDLAKSYRKELNIKIIGITGSNGKTTTKDLLKTVISKKYKTKQTYGNLNNEIGVPKTILNFDDDTQVGIVEMGIEDFNEMNVLTDIVNPDIAVITNIGDSHLLKLKSREGIAEAKLEILNSLSDDGIFIYNGDDITLKKVFPQFKDKIKNNQKVITFGQNDDNDFIVKEIDSNRFGNSFSHEENIYNVPLLGNHQIYNGAVAVLIGNILQIDNEKIKEGLKEVKSTKNRNEIIECKGFDILNDAYKSNPQNLTQALETMKFLQGYKRKIAVLGDMLELGENQEELHREIGEKLDPKSIDYVLLFGNLSKYIYNQALKTYPKNRIYHFESKNDLIDELKYIIVKSTLVLVKGSRAMHMEEIIEAIKELKVE